MSVALGLTAIYFTVPYDFFYKLTQTNKTPHTYSVNEMGMAIQRVESSETYDRYIKEDSNRAEQFIAYNTGMVKSVLSEKRHNDKSALDIMASGPLDAASDFSDILSGVPVGNSPNKEAKVILEKVFQDIPQDQLGSADITLDADLAR